MSERRAGDRLPGTGIIALAGSVLVIAGLILGARALLHFKQQLFSGTLLQSAPRTPEPLPESPPPPAPVPSEETAGEPTGPEGESTVTGEPGEAEEEASIEAPPEPPPEPLPEPRPDPPPPPREEPRTPQKAPSPSAPAPAPKPPTTTTPIRGTLAAKVEVSEPWGWTPLDLDVGPVTLVRWRFQATDAGTAILVAKNPTGRDLKLSLGLAIYVKDEPAARFRDTVTLAPGPEHEVTVRLGPSARHRQLKKVRAIGIDAEIGE